MARLGLVARLSNEVWDTCRSCSKRPADRHEDSHADSPANSHAVSKDREGAACDVQGDTQQADREVSRRSLPLEAIVFEEACTHPLLGRLQDAFSPSSPFWPEHNYFEEDTPYFSYLYSLVSQFEGNSE